MMEKHSLCTLGYFPKGRQRPENPRIGPQGVRKAPWPYWVEVSKLDGAPPIPRGLESRARDRQEAEYHSEIGTSVSTDWRKSCQGVL